MYGSYKLLNFTLLIINLCFAQCKSFSSYTEKMLKQLQMSKTQSFLSRTIYMEVIGFFFVVLV